MYLLDQNMTDAQITELLRQILEKIQSGSGTNRATLNVSDPELVRNLSKFSDSIKRTTKETSFFRSFIDGQKRTLRSYGEILDSLKEFDQSIKDTTDLNKILDLQDQKSAYLQAINDERKATAANNFAVGVRNITTNFVASVGRATQEFVSTLQQGGSGISVATGALTAAVDFIGKSASGVGEALTGLGASIFAGSGPLVKLKVLGAALAGTGLTLQAFGGVTDTVKFGLKVLSEELTKAVDTFYKITSAGALFADGVTGFRNAAFDAEISTKDLADAVKASNESLYTSGLDIGSGVTLIGKVFKSGGDEFKRRLLNLGYNFQEQAELIADTMKYLSLAGQRNIKDMAPESLRVETEKYARNLKLISAITGDDAKKRMESARQSMANAAVQAELAKMDKKTREQFQADLTLVDEEYRSAVLQQRLLGTVVDKNVAIMMGMAPELGESITAMAANLGRGTDVMGRIREQFASNLRASMEAGKFTEVGLTAVAQAQGTGTEFANFLSKLFLNFQKGAKEGGSVDNIITKFEQMVTTSDDLTTNLNKLNIQGAKMASMLEKELNEVLPLYSKALNKANEELIDALNETAKYLRETFGGQNTSTTGGIFPPIPNEITLGSSVAWAAELGRNLGQAFASTVRDILLRSDMFRSDMFRFDTTPPVPPEGAGGLEHGEIAPAAANGAILKGPSSGFAATLHGTEAVVPLPDGRTIPVSFPAMPLFNNNLNISSLVAGVTKIKQAAEDIKQAATEQVLPLEIKRTIEMSNNSLKEVLREQIDLMRDSNDKFQRLMDIASDTRNINQQILNTAY